MNKEHNGLVETLRKMLTFENAPHEENSDGRIFSKIDVKFSFSTNTHSRLSLASTVSKETLEYSMFNLCFAFDTFYSAKPITNLFLLFRCCCLKCFLILLNDAIPGHFFYCYTIMTPIHLK